MEMNKKCVNCGRLIPLSYKACPYCGSSQLGIEKKEIIVKDGKKKIVKKQLKPIQG